MSSDQMRKYGISESIIQALHYDIVGNKVIVFWIQRCHTFSFCHSASSAWCIMRYTVLSWSCLFSFLCMPICIHAKFHVCSYFIYWSSTGRRSARRRIRRKKVKSNFKQNMKVKIEISICTGLMLNHHSNPYIESTIIYIFHFRI